MRFIKILKNALIYDIKLNTMILHYYQTIGIEFKNKYDARHINYNLLNIFFIGDLLLGY